MGWTGGVKNGYSMVMQQKKEAKAQVTMDPMVTTFYAMSELACVESRQGAESKS